MSFTMTLRLLTKDVRGWIKDYYCGHERKSRSTNSLHTECNNDGEYLMNLVVKV